MDKFRGAAKLLIFLLIFSLLITSTTEDGEKQHRQRPNAAERAMGITDSLRLWDKVRYWIKIAWMNSIPSETESEKVPLSAGEVMKEAVAKSFETSKETAEHTAKIAGDVVHKTAEKVKRTVSGSEDRVQDL